MYTVKTPYLFRKLFHKFVWKLDVADPVVYLTFDDGPTPGVTEQVLDLLRDYKARATFFCVGSQIQKHPELYQRLLNEGHAIGNHTMTHLDARKVDPKLYLKEFKECNELMKTNLFRPPYGKITKAVYKYILPSHKVIMWDVLSGDFDPKVDAEQCASNVIDNIEKGSIVVFHDSKKAEATMLPALSETLRYLASKGYKMEVIQ